MATSSTVLRGRVIRLDGSGRPDVEVPSLGQGYVIGPLEVATPSVVEVGARVVVASLSAVSEDLVVVGVIGAEAVSGGGAAVVETFTFADPVLSWELPHAFGAMPASIVLVDPGGSEMLGEIDHAVDLLSSTVTWDTATAGTAYVFAGGSGPRGATGATGQSAYQLAVANGFVGTLAQWLESLVGDDGAPGAAGAAGPSGKSTYELAVINGFVGTEAEWLASLQGDDGAPGAAGPAGPAGVTRVFHGNIGSTARPDVPLAYWIGLATPDNAEDWDWWLPEDVPAP